MHVGRVAEIIRKSQQDGGSNSASMAELLRRHGAKTGRELRESENPEE